MEQSIACDNSEVSNITYPVLEIKAELLDEEDSKRFVWNDNTRTIIASNDEQPTNINIKTEFENNLKESQPLRRSERNKPCNVKPTKSVSQKAVDFENCGLCEMGFRTEKALKEHYVTVHKFCTTCNAYCNKGFFHQQECEAMPNCSQLNKRRSVNQQISKGNQSLQCMWCAKTFSTELTLRLASCQPTVCSECNEVFAGEDDLAVHKKANHSNQQLSKKLTYPCLRCNKNYSRESTLRKHNKKCCTFCWMCNRSFTSVKSLNAHIRADHKKQKALPIQDEKSPRWFCSPCNQFFAKKQSLARHQRLMHKTKKPKIAGGRKKGDLYQCSMCNNKYRTAMGLEFHYSVHNLMSPSEHFSCGKCWKLFKTSDELLQHENELPPCKETSRHAEFQKNIQNCKMENEKLKALETESIVSIVNLTPTVKQENLKTEPEDFEESKPVDIEEYAFATTEENESESEYSSHVSILDDYRDDCDSSARNYMEVNDYIDIKPIVKLEIADKVLDVDELFNSAWQDAVDTTKQDISKNTPDMNSHTNQRQRCEKCGAYFLRITNYKQHKKECKSMSVESSHHSSMESVLPDKHVLDSHMFPCAFCNRNFQFFDHMKRHVNDCHAPKAHA